MRSAEGEIDYLARAKPNPKAKSFRDVVADAFLREHNCSKGEHIAEAVGRSTGWVSTMLNHPDQVESEAFAVLLAPIRDARLRKRLLRAWVLAKFGEDLHVRGTTRLSPRQPSSHLLKRLYTQVSYGELFLAASTAVAAARNCSDPVLTDQFLDLALMARQASNLPGHAMQVANWIIERGFEAGDYARAAYGFRTRAQILLALPTSTPEAVEIEISRAEMHLESGIPAFSPPLPYKTLQEEDVSRFRCNAELVFAERGLRPISPDRLKLLATEYKALTHSRNKSRRFQGFLFLARIYVLQGNLFLAREMLEQGYRSAGRRLLYARELASLVEGRLRAAEGYSAESSDYLMKAANNFLGRWDLYHTSVLEEDLARLELKRFAD